MKKKIIVLLSALGLFLPPLLPALHAEDNAAAATSAQAAATPNRGSLYRVRHHGSTAYLFGTIHVGKPAFYPLGREVTQALAQSTRLVVELDVRKADTFQAALQKHGMYANGDRIEHHLSASTLTELRTALERFDISFEQVAHLKPWLLVNMLVGLDLERHGYERMQGLEYFLLTAAQQQTKAVQELESADYQLSLYDGMSETDQESYVRENLAQIKAGEALKRARQLIDAWDSANAKAIEDMLREETQDNTVSGQFMQRVLLDKRNPEMTEKIAGYMQADGTTFVGVGLLHLVGDNGVPRLLQQRGYEVEKLY